MDAKRVYTNRIESGAVAIIVAVLMTVLLGFTALVIDVGRLYETKREMQTVVDAAALAGVQELPESPSDAVNRAIEYGAKNDFAIAAQDVEVYTTYYENDTIAVTATKAVGFIFAPVLNQYVGDVPARAVAIVGSPSAVGQGVWPVGVMSKDASATEEFGYAFGEPVQLKTPSKGSGDSTDSAGNFFFLDLDDDENGARVIYDALAAGGVENWVYVETLYPTQTGINGITVMKSVDKWINCDHSFEEVARDVDGDGMYDLLNPGNESGGRCHRIVVVPIIINPEYPEGDPRRYNWSEIEGKKDIFVMGFAFFYVQDWGTSGTQSWINGRFIRLLTPDEMELGAFDPEYGVKAVKLIE